MRKLLTQLHMDLLKLDSNDLTLVTYDYDTHDIQFNQLGRNINIGYIGLYYDPVKKPLLFKSRRYKIGILNQHGLTSILRDLEELLGNNLIDQGQLLFRPEELGIGIYRRLKDARLPYPSKFWSFNFMNIRNSLLVKWVCNTYSDKSRLLYKTYSKSNKS